MMVSTPASPAGSILAINGGSSTLKFALFQAGAFPARTLSGSIDRIGAPEATLIWAREDTGTAERRTIMASDHLACVEPLLACINDGLSQNPLVAIGHRVVHGGRYREPQLVMPAVMEELQRLRGYDPEHLPAEIRIDSRICTAVPSSPRKSPVSIRRFTVDMPRVARLLPIPRRYEQLGLQRYGFHGLSYAFLMRELERVGTPDEVNGRVILAHLGNGASMAAVKHGKAVDTTMSFTPASGLPMSRRSGDLDPGLVAYLSSYGKHECGSVSQDGEYGIRLAWRLGDECRHARPPQAGAA